MKKIITLLLTLTIAGSVAFAQDNAGTAAPKHDNAAALKNKKAAAKDSTAKHSNHVTSAKDENSGSKPAHLSGPPKVVDNKVVQTKNKLSEQEIDKIIHDEMMKDPSHPMSASEIEARKADLRKNGLTKTTGKKDKKGVAEFDPNKPHHLQDPGKPLTEEQKKKLIAEGKAIPPPPPPPLPKEVKNTNPPSADDPDAPRFEFVGGNTWDYGEIMESNTPSPHVFEFVNVGKKPLIIQEAHGSCGCTVPTYSKEPVLPGQKSKITVNYNSRGRIGQIHKDVTITSNAIPSPVMLHITGTVKGNPELGPPTPPTPPGPPPGAPAAPQPQPAPQPGH
jgi:hypothetical protein